MLHRILIGAHELDFVVSSLEDRYSILRLWERPSEDEIAEARALVWLGHQSPDPLISQLPRLELVACFTTGYDGVDVAALNRCGIRVSHVPAISAEPVAEYALALILAAFRNVVLGDRLLRSGNWVPDGNPLVGRSLHGARIGIVGLGAIGMALARRCELLGMQIAWWGPRTKTNIPWPRAENLEVLAGETDALVVCARADETNRGMISAAVIDAIGPNGLLVNIARGQLVDEDALIAALRSGRIGGAALDVFAQEPTPAERWADVPNLICTPHIAGASRDALPDMTAMLRANLDAFFDGLPLPNPAQ